MKKSSLSLQKLTYSTNMYVIENYFLILWLYYFILRVNQEPNNLWLKLQWMNHDYKQDMVLWYIVIVVLLGGPVVRSYITGGSWW